MLGRSVTHQVRQEAETAQLVYSCLGRLRFLFAMHIWDHGNVDECKIIVPDAELKLSHSLYEWRGFDVADSTAQLMNN